MLNPITPEIEAEFRRALPLKTFPELQDAYLQEPRGRYKAGDALLIAPSTTAEVAQVVKLADTHAIGIVPYGGGTGLVGGQIAENAPRHIILSMERMTAITQVFPQENVLIAQAGAILHNIHQSADAVDRLFPLSLASEGSARIGGCLATNAGGVNVLRYGNARDLCLGLEVVWPNGTIWNGLSRLRKDNTGYDLRHLMIGSEGTLGIITAASLRLFAKPARAGTALFVVEGPSAALNLMAMARDHMGEAISAFELIHRQGLDFIAETLPDIRLPFPEPPEWVVLIDVGLPKALDPADTLLQLFEDAQKLGLVHDGLIAQSEQQRAEFWSIREHIPEANRRIGSVSSHDISVPLGCIAEFIDRGRDVIRSIGDFRINCFGHLGDGNLHYNVFPMPGKSRADHQHQRDQIKSAVHDLTHKMGGSVSAEHGVGRLKVGDLERFSDPAKLQTMRAIKAAIDPKGIMNPGAVLRDIELRQTNLRKDLDAL
ncbi:FAD-binding oxidoreductase [Parasulfitobacter algicola]|uniref:FAD-binding oxidoreductase n=1 Tax=Parasulfitobacter algicola TaxID=2614809 RepID=A0ABX2J032_9RHOB|nr:FAD-binding oxidoreductase [Sulfitobacter algicola]NSX56048.1 FAD-binding oxidoreductase [Sulfitobacter algicola]